MDGLFEAQVAAQQQMQGLGNPFVPINPYANIPGMQNPNPMIQMASQFFIQPMVQKMMGDMGMAPFGVTGQNPYNVMQNMQFQQEQMSLRASMATQEGKRHMQFFRGLATLQGVEFDADRQKSAAEFSKVMIAAAPMLMSLSPQTLEMLGGRLGSPMVAAENILMGNRFRRDVVTGGIGMTAASAGQMAYDLTKGLYAEDRIADMRGLTIGQTGELIGELSRRGALPPVQSFGSVAPTAFKRMDLAEQLSVMQKTGIKEEDFANLTPDQVEKLRATTEMRGAARSIDADKVQDKLKEWTEVVATMRDIFGAMGQPDAPMAKLIAGLEVMTQGSTQHVSKQKLQQITQDLFNSAQLSGVGMDKAMEMAAFAGGRAQQLGLSGIFAPQATAYALSHGAGLASLGAGGANAWGFSGIDAVRQQAIDAQLRFSKSQVGNDLGAFMRMSRDATAGGKFEEGTNARALQDAIRSGAMEFQFTDPVTKKTRTMNIGSLTPEQLQSIVGTGGVSQSVWEMARRNVSANQEFQATEGLNKYALDAQAAQTQAPRIARAMRNVAMTVMTSMAESKALVGTTKEDRFSASGTIARALQKEVMDTFTLEDLDPKNQDAVQKRMTKFIDDTIMMDPQIPARLRQQYAAMSPADKEKFQREIWMESRNKTSANNLALYGGRAKEAAEAHRISVQEVGKMQKAFQKLGVHGNVLQRLISGIQELKSEDRTAEAYQKILVEHGAGGISLRDIEQSLKPLAEEVMREKEYITQESAEIEWELAHIDDENKLTPKEKAEKRARILERRKKLSKRSDQVSTKVAELDKVAVQLGLDKAVIEQEKVEKEKKKLKEIEDNKKALKEEATGPAKPTKETAEPGGKAHAAAGTTGKLEITVGSLNIYDHNSTIIGEYHTARNYAASSA